VEESVIGLSDILEGVGYEIADDTSVEQLFDFAESFIDSTEFEGLDEATKKGWKMIFGKMKKLGKAALRGVKKTVKKVKQGYHQNRAKAAVKRADAVPSKGGRKAFSGHLKTAAKHARKSGDKGLQKTIGWARQALKPA